MWIAKTRRGQPRRIVFFISKLWHNSDVPVFLERFMLPLFVAIIVIVAVTNPMGFDRTQRVTGAIAIVFMAYFVGYTVHRYNESKKAPIQQPVQIESINPKPTPEVRPLAQPLPTPPRHLAQASPKPTSNTAEVIPFSVRHLDSGNAEFPYEMRITLQPKVSIQPIHVILKCKEEFGLVKYGFTFPGGMMGVLDGINPRPKEYEFMIGSPALTPENPLIIRVLSATHNEVIEVERH